MRIGLSICFFVLTSLLFSQDLPEIPQDSLPKKIDFEEVVQDSLFANEPLPEKKSDSLVLLEKEKLREEAKKKKPLKTKKKP